MKNSSSKQIPLPRFFASFSDYPLKEYLAEEYLKHKKPIKEIALNLSTAPQDIIFWLDVYKIGHDPEVFVIDEWLTKPLVKGVAHDSQPNIYKD